MAVKKLMQYYIVDDPQWEGQEPNSLTKKIIEANRLTNQSYSPLSLVSKKFLANSMVVTIKV